MNQEGGFTLTLPFLLYSYFLYVSDGQSGTREAEYEGEIDPQRPSLLTSPTRKKTINQAKSVVRKREDGALPGGVNKTVL